MLQVSDISLGYSGKTILQQVNFSVEQGKLTSLLGHSGVGKSSLLRILAGLDRPLSGEVRLNHQQISSPLPNIAFVFQSATLLPWLNVAENVAFGLDFTCRERLDRQEIRQRVEQALSDVGLSEHSTKMPSELSGGMAQRVNLARAFARHPSLILLDEPFSALDEVTRSQMQQQLHHLVRQHNTAAVLITHDIDEALMVSDEILLLAGKPAEIAGRWQLTSPFPREDLLLFNDIRVDILQSLRRYQQRRLQEQTVDFII